MRRPGPCRSEFDHRSPDAALSPDGVPDVITTYDYDDDGRLVRSATRWEQEPGRTRSKAYRYDDEGRLMWQRTENTGVHSILQIERSRYDENGRLVETTIAEGSEDVAPGMRTIFRYDGEGRLILRELQTIATGRGRFRRRFVHDGDRLVREEVDNAGKGTYPSQIVLAYDPEGRVEQRIHKWDNRDGPSEIERFTYDEHGRLVQRLEQRPEMGEPDAGVATIFRYDAGGNVVAKETRAVGIDRRFDLTTYDYGCWTGQAQAARAIVPFDFRTRLDQIPAVTF